MTNIILNSDYGHHIGMDGCHVYVYVCAHCIYIRF